jgi:ABC-type amino acid transport substrate-binding protein
MGMCLLLALGLSFAGVIIGSVALSEANDNEDNFTDRRDVILEDLAKTEGPTPTPANDDDIPTFIGGSPTLQAIYDRGALKCAVVPSTGFTEVSDTGELFGIDIDIVSSCWHVLSN